MNRRHFVNVLDYGADPTGKKDSTVAFERANEVALRTPGASPYAPSGIYKVNASRLPSVVGEDPSKTVIRIA